MYLATKLKQSCSITINDQLSTTVDFKDLSDGCIGVMLVFDNKEDAVKFSGGEDVYEVKKMKGGE